MGREVNCPRATREYFRSLFFEFLITFSVTSHFYEPFYSGLRRFLRFLSDKVVPGAFAYPTPLHALLRIRVEKSCQSPNIGLMENSISTVQENPTVVFAEPCELVNSFHNCSFDCVSFCTFHINLMSFRGILPVDKPKVSPGLPSAQRRFEISWIPINLQP